MRILKIILINVLIYFLLTCEKEVNFKLSEYTIQEKANLSENKEKFLDFEKLQDLNLEKIISNVNYGLGGIWVGQGTYFENKKQIGEEGIKVEVKIELCEIPYSQTIIFLNGSRQNLTQMALLTNIMDKEYVDGITYIIEFDVPGDFSFSKKFIDSDLEFNDKRKSLQFLGNEYFSKIIFSKNSCEK